MDIMKMDSLGGARAGSAGYSSARKMLLEPPQRPMQERQVNIVLKPARKLKQNPANTDKSGLPFEPCLVCESRFFVKRQDQGAHWYCWECLGKDENDTLGYRDPQGGQRYLDSCSFGEGWVPSA